MNEQDRKRIERIREGLFYNYLCPDDLDWVISKIEEASRERVCEWRLVRHPNSVFFSTSCGRRGPTEALRQSIEGNVYKFTYCPYCKGKIKDVEYDDRLNNR